MRTLTRLQIQLEMLFSQKLGHLNPSAGWVFWVRPAMKERFHMVTTAAPDGAKLGCLRNLGGPCHQGTRQIGSSFGFHSHGSGLVLAFLFSFSLGFCEHTCNQMPETQQALQFFLHRVTKDEAETPSSPRPHHSKCQLMRESSSGKGN